ncbi:sensor histidine kinase [Sediminibacillus sp. JSM 1682029]|uniref:cache domain-containing sensor histidine kinase n=1 Tax=Sediminibacillus sp. JSM 1682029 TaxID=3229857 RepID=UPI00352543DC
MKGWIYRLNIQQRLLVYFVVVILVSVSLVTWLFYRQTTLEIKKQSEGYLEYIVENASYQTDLFIRDLELATLPLLTDRTVKGFLEIDESQRLEQYYYSKEIKSQMHNLNLKYQHLNLIYLLGENGQYVLSKNKSSMEEEPFPSKAIYRSLLKTTPENGRIRLLADRSLYNQEYVVSIVRRVRGLSSFVPKGILGVELNGTALEELWNIAQFENGTSLWIFDDNHRVVYHPDQKWLGNPIGKQLEDQLTTTDKKTFTGEWDGTEMIFYADHSDQTNWTLVAMTPKEVIYEPVAGMKKQVVFVLVLSLMVALVVSIGFANSIVKPLRKIQKGMKKMEIGEWEPIKPLRGTDEISSVVTSYNKMIDRLSTLVDDLYAAELQNHKVLYEKQKIELQALQSQINPHFLHNTLETMNSYAILNDAEEISEMAISLSQMFRYSVRNLEIVTLEDEMNHVKNFMIVEEHRFQKHLPITFEIEEDLFDEEVVKLSLQPLVENAIHHGLRKNRYQGEITIRATAEEKRLRVEVIDNGAGITPARLRDIRKVLRREKYEDVSNKMGIGVSNVHRRIQLLFGEQCGLTIQSQQGEGTKVSMEIPRKDRRIKVG